MVLLIKIIIIKLPILMKAILLLVWFLFQIASDTELNIQEQIGLFSFYQVSICSAFQLVVVLLWTPIGVGIATAT